MNKFYVSLLCLFMVGVLRAQSPGGVGTANLSLWLKPDGLTAGSLSTWNYANNGNSFTAGPTAPTVVANTFNFWPAVNFNGSSGTSYMTGPSGASAPLALNQLPYAIFAVWSSSQPVGGANMRIWAQRESTGGSAFDGASLFLYPGAANSPGQFFAASGPTYGDQPEVSPFTTGVAFPTQTATVPYSWTTGSTPATTAQSILTYAPNTTSNPAYISSLNLLNANTNDLELMDQSNYGTTPAVTSTDPNASATTNRLLSTQENILGARTTTLNDENFTGNLAELIIFNTSVTATQRQQVFSYLALKYGLPLNGNYLSSSSATIWNTTAGGSAYNNFVFGLGVDNASGLTISQSNSMSTSGVSNAANITLSSPSTPTDQGFMMVGSNNAGTAQTQANVPTVASGSWRLSDQWLVQNTGTVGTVNVAVDLTGVNLTASGSTLGTSSDFRLVTDNDGDGDFTTGTQSYYTPTSWTSSNNVANFTAVDLTRSSNVVFTVITGATGGTPLPVNWVNFTAVPKGGNVNLNWTVGANQQAKVYEVQRSADGTNFTNIGEVANDVSVQNYSYVDAGVGSGTYFYRVLEVDLGGESIYSKIVSVNMSAAAFAIKLLNNPTVTGKTDAELQLTTNTSGNVLMEIWTLSGSRVGSFQQAIGAGTTTMRVPATSLSAGTYAVKITFNNNTQTVQVVKL
jgi:hypothetical protein